MRVVEEVQHTRCGDVFPGKRASVRTGTSSRTLVRVLMTLSLTSSAPLMTEAKPEGKGSNVEILM